MERRILASGVILTVSIIILIGVFFIYSNSKDGSNPVKSIPQDAAIILKLNGYGLLDDFSAEKTDIWKDLLPIESVGKLNNTIKNIDSIFTNIPELKESLNHSEMYISGHLSGNRNIYFLSIIPLPEGFDSKDLKRIGNNSKGVSYTERKYEGKSIINLSIPNKKNLHFAFFNGLLACSSSPMLIEDAIRQSTLTTSLLDNQEFFKMFEATGKNKDANIFIDLNQAGRIFSLFTNKKYTSKSKNFTKLGGWTELDINLRDDVILLNGFTYPIDTLQTYLATLSENEPVRISIPEVLPSNTSGFIAYAVSSPQKAYNSYLKYLDEIGKLANYKANLKNINLKYGVEFDKIFLNLLDDQLALAHKINTSTNSGTEYLVLKCKSGNDAKDAMEKLTAQISPKIEGKLKYEYSPDNEVKFTIYRLPIYPLFGRVMGEFFNVFEENYIVIVDNYLVVASTYKDASKFLYDYMLKRTLNNNKTYQSFSNSLSAKSYALAYINLANSQHFFDRYLKEDVQNSWSQNTSVFHKAQSLGIQISEVSDIPYFNIFLKHQDDFRGKPQTVWESLIDSTLSKKPKFVINHYTKQNEIIIQDDKRNLYLMNQAGRILWKVSLDETINSEIYQVDYFKNGKLQFLFSTKSALHLVDRNGNYVERYPVKLRSESTAGMSLFDYESNKNYRIFIPCKNKKVYAYSKDGNIISGWKFNTSDHIVTQSIQHFRVETKDYLVFGDKRNTYILDRQGNTRVQLNENFVKSHQNTYYLNNTGVINTAYFTTTDTSGTVIKIFLNGRTEKLDLQKLSEQHYFDFKDVNSDGKSDYIFLDQKDLYVYDSKKKLLYKKTFKHNLIKAPIYYNFSHTDRKIGVVTEDNNIYLINNNGENYKGFPLEGKTQFTVGYFDLTSSRFNLIVGGSNNFLYNYAVE